MSDQGRNADILQSIVDDVPYTDPPQSRIEDLLLQVKEVIEEGGGTKIRLADVSGAAVATSFNNATLTWSDPEDIVVSGAVLAKWAGTKVLRKAGSAPESITDGVVVVDSKVKNQYSSNGFEDRAGIWRNVLLQVVPVHRPEYHHRRFRCIGHTRTCDNNDHTHTGRHIDV